MRAGARAREPRGHVRESIDNGSGDDGGVATRRNPRGGAAARLTMFLKNALVTKEITAGGYRLVEPSRTMQRLNAALVEQNLSYATFATALYGRIDATSLTLTFALGGHPNPLLLTKGGELR